MLIRDPGEAVRAETDFPDTEASLVSRELQRLAFLLAYTGDPDSSSERTNLLLSGKNQVSTILDTSRGARMPHRVLKIKQPGSSDISWQPSGNGNAWKDTRSHSYINNAAFNHTVRPIVESSNLGKNDLVKSVFEAQADNAFYLLESWIKRQPKTTFTTEVIYKDDSVRDIARQFTTTTTTTPDKMSVLYELEITGSIKIGRAVADRTICIGAIDLIRYDQEDLDQNETSRAYASISLQSDSLNPEELLAAHSINLDAGVICEYISA